MKAVIQRVSDARLYVDKEVISEIGRGLVVYVGVEQSDTESDVIALCRKVAAMRIFSDADGKLNLSVRDCGGDVLMVSNFTLCAAISHGNRPSFTNAKRPVSDAKVLFDYSVDVMRDLFREVGAGGNVACGVFGADMRIEQSNDGPVTVIY